MFASLQELETMLDTKKIMLSNEPPLGDEKAITIVVRMPNGGRYERRFLKTDKLQVKIVLKNMSSQSFICFHVYHGIEKYG